MIPKSIRDIAGLTPGVVEVVLHGTGIHVEALATEALEERGDRLVIPSSGAVIDDDLVRALRDGDQR